MPEKWIPPACIIAIHTESERVNKEDNARKKIRQKITG
jgi:hypothetical protein